jgi:hypothetical protein
MASRKTIETSYVFEMEVAHHRMDRRKLDGMNRFHWICIMYGSPLDRSF